MSILRKGSNDGEPKAGGEMQKAASARALSPYEEMDQMFDRFFPQAWSPLRPAAWRELMRPFETMAMPRVDVVDRDNEIVVRAEMPGVKKEDVEVSMTDRTVTIRGSSRREEKEEKGEYYRCEIARGSFSRTITLPEHVDSNRSKATFKDGILELALPKVEKTQRRVITVE